MSRQPNESSLITADKVIISFDPVRVIADGGVGVRDGRIEWVGSLEQTPAQRYQQRLDVSGTILPGLIDAHVHLSFDSTQDDPVTHAVDLPPDALRATIADNAARLLRSGVTTVRDLGSPAGSALQFGASVEQGAATGPTVIASDQPLTRTRGHLWAFAKQIDSVHDADAAVADLVARGAKVIKVMVTGGRMTAGTCPEAVEFRPDLLATVVTRAHTEGVTVAAHTLATDGIRAAVAAGVDTIEHCTFIEPDGTPCSESSSAELAAQIADAGIYVCPTLNSVYDRENPHPIHFDQRAGWVRALFDHGAKIILGNDTGIPGLPPELYWGGLEALELAGMSPEAVLHAATHVPAAAMGIAGEAGTLAPGLRADLLAVDGDPLQDLRHLQKPTMVMARGTATTP